MTFLIYIRPSQKLFIHTLRSGCWWQSIIRWVKRKLERAYFHPCFGGSQRFWWQLKAGLLLGSALQFPASPPVATPQFSSGCSWGCDRAGSRSSLQSDELSPPALQSDEGPESNQDPHQEDPPPPKASSVMKTLTTPLALRY